MLRRYARLLLPPVALGLLGAWLAILMAGRADYDVGPFRVELFARPGKGLTEIALPPLGLVRADTHLSPIRLTATLREVQPDALARAVRRNGLEQFVLQTQERSLDALGSHGRRTVGVGVLGAAGVGLLAFRTRWREVAVAAAAGLVALSATAGAARLTYRPEAFAAPTFTGSLTLAPQLIGPIRQATGRIDDFRLELERLVGGAVNAYTTISEAESVAGASVVALHVSDIHLSPLGIDFARRLASAFRVDLVIDTGDLTSFGTPLEEGIVSEIATFRVPYVFVRGNHDPRDVADRIARLKNGRVLDGEVQQVAGVRIYGAPHPAFTPDKERAPSQEEFREAALAAGEAIASDLRALDDPPDLLAVHDAGMAEASTGIVPVALSGHFHEADARLEDGTLFLQAGTTGAAGLDTFTRERSIPLSAEILYLDGDPLRPVAWDVIELDPTTRDLTVDRHLVSEEGSPEPASPEPVPSP